MSDRLHLTGFAPRQAQAYATLLLAVNVQSTDKWYSSATEIPQETWFCYKWHVTGAATTVYFNGTELSDIDAPGISGPASALRLGFQRWQPGAEGDIWIDDVAVNDTQLGCD